MFFWMLFVLSYTDIGREKSCSKLFFLGEKEMKIYYRFFLSRAIPQKNLL